MAVVNWYRVTDPLSPLYGCDVRGDAADLVGFMRITSMRRVDIFVGDRPFQLVAPPGESLGLLIDEDQLDESPLQDDIIELTTELPYGECLDDYEASRGDGLEVHVVSFERAVQVALLKEGKLLSSRTFPTLFGPSLVLSLFEDGAGIDEILECMVGPDGEEAL